MQFGETGVAAAVVDNSYTVMSGVILIRNAPNTYNYVDHVFTFMYMFNCLNH